MKKFTRNIRKVLCWINIFKKSIKFCNWKRGVTARKDCIGKEEMSQYRKLYFSIKK
jgi:hypothetical protein